MNEQFRQNCVVAMLSQSSVDGVPPWMGDDSRKMLVDCIYKTLALVEAKEKVHEHKLTLEAVENIAEKFHDIKRTGNMRELGAVVAMVTMTLMKTPQEHLQALGTRIAKSFEEKERLGFSRDDLEAILKMFEDTRSQLIVLVEKAEAA